MKQSLVAFVVGVLFSVGLGISGMTQPHKVVGFLDVFGNWDISLMFVMVGAIGVHFVVYKIFSKRAAPLLSAQWHLPTKKDLTPSLMIGAALFGIGWSLAGYCPGPALTSLAAGSMATFQFVGFMLLGMFVFKWLDKRYKFNR